MVTFFCSSCGQYLKKKQAEQHVDYCNDKLSCNDCKRVLSGFALIKAHVKCDTVQPNKQSKGPNTKEVKVDDIEWTGFKNVLRAIVKRADGRRVNRDALKKLVGDVMRSNGIVVSEDFEGQFKSKLSGVKNLKQDGLLVKYVRE